MSWREIRAIFAENFSRGSIRRFIAWTLLLISVVAIWAAVVAVLRQAPDERATCGRIAMACLEVASDFDSAWTYVRDVDKTPSEHHAYSAAAHAVAKLRAQVGADNSAFIPLYASTYAALAIWILTFRTTRARKLAAAALLVLAALVTADVFENVAGYKLLDAMARCADERFVSHTDTCTSVSGEAALARHALASEWKWGCCGLLMLVVGVMLFIGTAIHRKWLRPAAALAVVAGASSLLSIVLDSRDTKVLLLFGAMLGGAATIVAFASAVALRWVMRVKK